MEAQQIDIEMLITLVQDRHVLWDKTIEEYKNRIETRNAWVEVYKELYPGFEEMGEKEKNEYGKSIIKKWGNIRDSFQRSERMMKSSLKSGSGRKAPRIYVYGQQLQFLKKPTVGRPTEDRLSVASNEILAQLSENEGEVADNATAETLAEEAPPRPTPNKKKRKPDAVELELLCVLKETPNRHMSFFRGITPSLETFDEDEVVEFQLKVMQLISDMKKRNLCHLLFTLPRDPASVMRYNLARMKLPPNTTNMSSNSIQGHLPDVGHPLLMSFLVAHGYIPFLSLIYIYI